MSGRIIGCVSVAGGAGHTTLVLDLAGTSTRNPKAILDLEERPFDEWSKWQIPEGITLLKKSEFDQSGSMERLRKEFALLLVHAELGSGLVRTFLESSDLILIPLSPDFGSLLKVRDATTVFDSCLIPRARVVVVLNHVQGSPPPEIVNGLSALGVRDIGHLAEDQSLHSRAQQEGVIPTRLSPDSSYAEGVRRLAEALISEPVLNRRDGHSPDSLISNGDRPDCAMIVETFRHRLVKELEDGRREAPKNAPLMNRATVEATLQRLMAEDENGASCLSLEERRRVFEQVIHRVIGLGPLEELLADDSLSEIMVRGINTIWIERGGKLKRADQCFKSLDELTCVIERIVSPLGRRVDESVPLCDARLPDGSRVNIIIPPVALEGPEITIRKFRKTCFSGEDLVERGALSLEMMEFLKEAVRRHQSLLVSGGTGSGKTTLLNALSSFIGSDERIVTIEDAAELRLQQDHVVRLEARPPNLEGTGAVTIRQLLINALRMRPDRIIIGECRGAEALDLLQALNTGHKGSLTTLHANSPREALGRLEVLALMAGIELPLRALREQIRGGVDCIVQVSRLPDGSRKMISITEVTGMEGDVITLSELYSYVGGAEGGTFQATGLQPQWHSY